MRAFSNAVLLLIFNLFGLGLGPWCTGMVSDLLIRHFGAGNDGLRYALSLSLAASAAGSLVLFRAARLYRVAMARSAQSSSPMQGPA